MYVCPMRLICGMATIGPWSSLDRFLRDAKKLAVEVAFVVVEDVEMSGGNWRVRGA